MTLATRCAACGTAFRVVEDQLKVSDGWVRCGSCNGVFNASEHLFSLPEARRPRETLRRSRHRSMMRSMSRRSSARVRSISPRQ
jgi:predicted Zn finger-like uncharacterized protein